MLKTKNGSYIGHTDLSSHFWLLLIVNCFLLGSAETVNASHSILNASDHSGQRHHLTFSTFPSEGMGELFKRILIEAYHQLGYTVTVKGYPAERALSMSNDGMVDGEAGRVAVIEEECRNLVRVPTPLYINKVAAFSRQANLDTTSGWKSLKAYRLGAVNGYKFVEKMTRPMNTQYYRSYPMLFKALDNSRVDVAVSEYLEALPTLGTLRMSRIGAHYPMLALKPMYHYLHKKHAWLVPQIDLVLQGMQEKGRMEAILQVLEAEYRQ